MDDCPAGLTVELAEDFVNEAKGTEVGDYDMGLKSEDFTLNGLGAGNYSPTFVVALDGCLHITEPTEDEINFDIIVEDWVYGASHAAPMAVATLKGTRVVYPEEPAVTYTKTGGGYSDNVPPTDAGQYTMTAVWPKTTNLPGSTKTAKFTIKPRPVTLTSASAEKVYDGTELTANGENSVTVGGMGWAEGEGAACEVTGSRKDAGSSRNIFTYALNEGTKAENYEITQAEGTLTVTRRPVTLYARSLVKKASEAQGLTFEAYAVGLVKGEELENITVRCDYDAGTPGRYPIHIEYTALGSNSNYLVTAVDGTLTITADEEEPPDAETLLVWQIDSEMSQLNESTKETTQTLTEVTEKLKDQADTLQSGLAVNDEVLKALDKLEDLYAEKAEITVTVDSKVAAVAEQDVDIVGAAFSEVLPGELCLYINKAALAPSSDYTSALTVDIGLVYKQQGIDTEVAIREPAVPVCITVPLPASITDPTGLFIRHYHDGAFAEPETIRPVVYQDTDGRWMARFCTDSFSIFDFVLPKHPAPSPGDSGSDGDDAPAPAVRTGAAETGAKQPAVPAGTDAAYRGAIPQTSDDFPLWGMGTAFVLALAGLAGLAAVWVLRRRRR